MLEILGSLFPATVLAGTPLLLGALGEILTERAGNLNLGVEGMMFMGAISGLAGSYFYEQAVLSSGGTPSGVISAVIALITSMLAGMLGALIYSFLTTSLRANQNVTGLTLTIFGSGLANFFGGELNNMAGGVGQISVAVTSGAYRANIPALANAGPLGRIFLSHGFMVYLAIVLAVVMSWFLNRTRAGLCLRAVGENPATADAAGINVTKYKYLATCLGAGISGLGGLYYTMDYIRGTWASEGTIEALGWLAVALVIFAVWRSLNAIWGAYLFGFLTWLYLYIPGLSRSSQELFKMLPYLATILVLVVVSLRKKRENQPPAHLGLSYFREER